MSELGDTVKLEGLGLDVGQSRRLPVCPCEMQKSGVFSITRDEEGLIWNCFSAACSSSGAVGGARRAQGRPSDATPGGVDQARFCGELEPIPGYVLAELYEEYELSAAIIRAANWQWAPATESLYMPVYNTAKLQTGEVLKSWRWNAEKDYRPKSRTYSWVKPTYGVYGLGWGQWHIPRVLLVEDCISGLVAGAVAPTISLLGTWLQGQVAAHLAKNVGQLVVMLDPDTWQMKSNPGLNMARKYRSLFVKGVKVLRIEDDPKYLQPETIRGMLDALSDV